MTGDPYKTLGVSRSATDAEIRRAYRRLVQLHHPDHNSGSAESTRRFEEIQEAYGQIVEQRKVGAGTRARSGATRAARSRPPPPPPVSDPDLEARLADIERKLREANAAHDRARRAAREAAAQADGRHAATDEELGYVTTDDSFSKILADARDQISGWFGAARDQPATRRAADLLDELAAKLRGEKPEE